MAFKINGLTVAGLGKDGAGIPAGGTANQILRKKSHVDFDSEWVDAPFIPEKTSDIINDSDFATTTYVHEKLQSHSNNEEFHITAEERELWNGANAYTDNAIAKLVGSAPDTLDTLEEISKALNEDSQYVINLAQTINTKQDKLTGNLNEIVTFDNEGNLITRVFTAEDFGSMSQEYLESELAAMNAEIDNVQKKNIIVYKENGKASLTPAEIMTYVRAGRSVYYTPDLQGGTLHPYLEGSDTAVAFYSNFIDNTKAIGTIVTIDKNSNVTTQVFQLGHLSDSTIHITANEREKWNSIEIDNYYTKTETDGLLEAFVNNQISTKTPLIIDIELYYDEEDGFWWTISNPPEGYSSYEILEFIRNNPDTTIIFKDSNGILYTLTYIDAKYSTARFTSAVYNNQYKQLNVDYYSEYTYEIINLITANDVNNMINAALANISNAEGASF